jgi:hypothetical protein
MEQNQNFSPEAAIHEAPLSNVEGPAFVSTLVSDKLENSFSETRRRCRHDGWTGEKMACFLEALAACGVVADACRAVGLSAQSAYQLRNRRAGRAWGEVWDAVLVNRSRARLGDDLMSRSLNGTIEAVYKDKAVVGERHRYDNRLSMAVLTRLDRLAERAEPRSEKLRALSEDFEEFLECLHEGGDADAFVAGRIPAPEQPSGPDPEALAGAKAGSLESFLLKNDAVWQNDDGSWWTIFPPPAGFSGTEEGVYGGEGWYARTLAEAERAVMEARKAAEAAEERAIRDRFFGFAGDGDEERTASEARRSQPSTSSTSPLDDGRGARGSEGDEEARKGEKAAGHGQRRPAIILEQCREGHGDDRDEQARISGAARADLAEDAEIEGECQRRGEQPEIDEPRPIAGPIFDHR